MGPTSVISPGLNGGPWGSRPISTGAGTRPTAQVLLSQGYRMLGTGPPRGPSDEWQRSQPRSSFCGSLRGPPRGGLVLWRRCPSDPLMPQSVEKKALGQVWVPLSGSWNCTVVGNHETAPPRGAPGAAHSSDPAGSVNLGHTQAESLGSWSWGTSWRDLPGPQESEVNEHRAAIFWHGGCAPQVS